MKVFDMIKKRWPLREWEKNDAQVERELFGTTLEEEEAYWSQEEIAERERQTRIEAERRRLRAVFQNVAHL